ncbi:hypothetical protein FRX31_030794 [Thalictrum thalictroides]|uniref:Uncharacterized protein n=1 Tax=Thalictrum thalictroides TaxID=46969 RepID=A0A7J6V4G8_THATH|nr:hypothetical protein FRX31_030794 [Thalictrum thalictroides]
MCICIHYLGIHASPRYYIGPRRLPNSPFPWMLGWHDLHSRNKSNKKLSEIFHPKKGFVNVAYPLDITLEERVAANLQVVEAYQDLVQAEYEESSTSRPVSCKDISSIIFIQKCFQYDYTSKQF